MVIVLEVEDWPRPEAEGVPCDFELLLVASYRDLIVFLVNQFSRLRSLLRASLETGESVS